MDERNELERLAAPLLADPPIARTPVGEIRRRATRRSRQRLTVVGVVALIVLLGAGTALARAGREAPVQVGTGPGTTAFPNFDLTLYVATFVSADDVAAIQRTLLDDPNVTRLLFSTQAQNYRYVRCIDAREPRVLENVSESDFGPIFRIGIAGGQAEVDRIAQEMSARIAGHQVLIYASGGYEVPTSTTRTSALPPGAVVGRMTLRTPSTLVPCTPEGTTLR